MLDRGLSVSDTHANATRTRFNWTAIDPSQLQAASGRHHSDVIAVPKDRQLDLETGDIPIALSHGDSSE